MSVKSLKIGKSLTKTCCFTVHDLRDACVPFSFTEVHCFAIYNLYFHLCLHMLINHCTYFPFFLTKYKDFCTVL